MAPYVTGLKQTLFFLMVCFAEIWVVNDRSNFEWLVNKINVAVDFFVSLQRLRCLQESIAKAEQICERIRTRRAAQNLESEIVQITKRIKKEEEK